MVTTAAVRRSRRRRTTAPVLPDDLVVWEILVRLPAKALLRCRAVCRAWRQFTSAGNFLIAHHRQQPSLPLVSFLGQVNRGRVTDASVETFDVRRIPVERRPVLGFNGYNHPSNFEVWASCDGLLLLSLSNNRFYLSLSNIRFYLCNPATRQWAALPSLTGNNVAAFYLHRPSGEYRVLYWREEVNAVYYILTVGSSEKPRYIGLPVALQSMKQVMVWGLNTASQKPPVLLHDCLHWVSPCNSNNKLIVFDTVVESFKWMRSPTYVADANLLVMDGALGISRVNKDAMKVMVWVLQDYKKESWSLTCCIELPLMEMRRITDSKYFYGSVVSDTGDILVRCRFPWYLFHFDSEGKLLEKYLWDGVVPSPVGLSYKESLVDHSFFQRRHSARLRVKQPRFFQGL